MKNFIIGVAGGSGSGKTTVAQHIINALGENQVAVIRQDSYYKDLSALTPEQRREVNFDHPDAFDWDLLKAHLHQLQNGEAIDMPTYDFAKDTRSEEVVRLNAAPIIVFEGIFSLKDKQIREMMSLRIFVDTAADIRLIRRLQRDIKHRGRSAQSVIDQYLHYVRPMHKKFIEPSKRHSHIIIPHGANRAALEMIIARINAVINQDVLLNDYFEEE
jgi:uridine kinase